MFFRTRDIRNLRRDEQYFKRAFGSSAFLWIRFHGMETTAEAIISLLTALPRFIKIVRFPQELLGFSASEIQKVLRHLPKTVHTVDFSYFPFETTALDLGELPPWIEQLSLCGYNYDYPFHMNPNSYIGNLIACIASIPSSIRFLSLRSQVIGEWPSEAFPALGNAIPHTIESLDLSNTTLGACRTSDIISCFSALQVSELNLSCTIAGRARTIQELTEILQSLPGRLQTLNCRNSFLDKSSRAECVRAVLQAVPQNLRSLTLDIPQKDFPEVLDALPPSIRALGSVPFGVTFGQNFRMPPHICHLTLGFWQFVRLISEAPLQQVVFPKTVRILTLSINGIDTYHHRVEYEPYEDVRVWHEWRHLAGKLPPSCSEFRLPYFNFWRLSIEECAAFFEALPPNIVTVDLSCNHALKESPKKLLAVVHGMPNTVRTVRLDNIELGSRFSTRELIELFQEIPRHLHLSLKQNDLFTGRTRVEVHEILSAIRSGRTLTTDTWLDHNGGESDALRALPALFTVMKKNILPPDMIFEVLSFLVPRGVSPRERLLKEPEWLEKPPASAGCCTIL